jgi:anti-anti-sigma factor
MREATAVCPIRIDKARLDLLAVERLEKLAQDALGSGASALVIDCAAMTSVDPVGLSALLMLRKRMPEGVPVALAALSPALQTLARILRLHDVFDIYADVQGALRDLSDQEEGEVIR